MARIQSFGPSFWSFFLFFNLALFACTSVLASDGESMGSSNTGDETLAAAAVNPIQREVLYRIRSELPALGTLKLKPWKDAAIDAVCETENIYGVGACNGTGWIENLNFASVDFGVPLGVMPPSLGDMLGLKQFYASGGIFSGPLLPELGQLTQLTSLIFTKNLALVGPIPDTWANLTALESLLWTDSSAPHVLPDWLGATWPTIFSIEIMATRARGQIPYPIANAPYLHALDLSKNELEGAIPKSVTSSSSLISLNLERNRLNGHLPADWSKNVLLESIELSNNHFEGNVPEYLPPMIETLDLDHNVLDGTIPRAVMDLPHLEFFSVSYNPLVGVLPWPTKYATSRLRHYSAEGCTTLQGTIPSFFWQIGVLEEFIMSGVQIWGPLPDTIDEFCTLTFISASDTHISGSLPSRIDYCSRLQYLILNRDFIEGTLPPALANSKSLKVLYLEQNRITGQLFQDWTNMTSLQVFSVDGNQLSGPVPPSLVRPNSPLTILNLKYNPQLQLCGEGSPTLVSSSISCELPAHPQLDCPCIKLWNNCSHEFIPSECDAVTPAPATQGSVPHNQGNRNNALPSWMTKGHILLIFGFLAAIWL